MIAASAGSIVVASNASQGAFFSQSWGWVALAFLVPTTLVLILDSAASTDRLRVAFALFMCALSGWIALSPLWSLTVGGSVREFERVIVYVGIALAIAIVLRRGDGPAVLAGVVIGTSVVSGYSLASRLFPEHIFANDDPFLANRLGQPLGYPNALGVLVALGMLATLAFVSHGQRSSSVALAASMLPVQAATLYFTFSRGALAVLILSYIAAVTLDPRWMRSLWASGIAALPSIACVAVAAQYDALTTMERSFEESVHEGRELAVIVLLLAACSALLAWTGQVAARRVKISPSTKRWTGIGIGSAAVAGARRSRRRRRPRAGRLSTQGASRRPSAERQI